MPDFRDELYRRYASTFKGAAPPLAGAALEGYWAWCAHKYLPLLAGLPREAALLELGCGAGQLLEFLKRQGFSHVAGIDISEEQVRLARQRGVEAVVADAFAYLAGAERSLDALIAVDFLEHFTKDELVALAPRMARALRAGGLLLVQTANGEGLFPRQVIYGDLTHLTIFTPASLGQLLRLYGFVGLEFFETGPAPVNPRGRLDAALWRLLKAAANAVRRIETGKRQEIWTENLICRARAPGPGGER